MWSWRRRTTQQVDPEPAPRSGIGAPVIVFGNSSELAYLHNPKAACTLALNFVFYANHGYGYFDPIQIHYSRRAFWRLNTWNPAPDALAALESQPRHIFTFVRDPVERLISAFTSKVWLPVDPYYAMIRDELTSLYDIDLSASADPKRSCLLFAKWIEQQCGDWTNADYHFRPQYLNLECPDYPTHTLIRLDRQKELAAFIAKWVGQPGADKILRSRYNEMANVKKADFLSDELVEVARRIYAADYEKFYPEHVGA
jgi:hypothetical protein